MLMLWVGSSVQTPAQGMSIWRPEDETQQSTIPLWEVTFCCLNFSSCAIISSKLCKKHAKQYTCCQSTALQSCLHVVYNQWNKSSTFRSEVRSWFLSISASLSFSVYLRVSWVYLIQHNICCSAWFVLLSWSANNGSREQHNSLFST